MGMRDSYLFPTLEAGSSRVFNVCFHTSRLLRSIEPGADETKLDYLFKTSALNQVIFVKETRPSHTVAQYQPENPVGTKLYIPYNSERIYDGGKSVFIDDPEIERILKHHAGLDLRNGSEEANQDLYLIRMLDEIPSLDPFLVKDKFEIEGITANEIYFEIPETEWNSIRLHVSEKLKPIITFAFHDSEALERRRTSSLLDKLWNTKDIQALMPIIKAFGLPEDEASGIFSAWKGIMYYEHEYNRCLPSWKEFVQSN